MCPNKHKIASVNPILSPLKLSTLSPLKETQTIISRFSKNVLSPLKWLEPHTKTPTCSMWLTAKSLKPSSKFLLRRDNQSAPLQHMFPLKSQIFKVETAPQTHSIPLLSIKHILSLRCVILSLAANLKALLFYLANKTRLSRGAQQTFWWASLAENVSMNRQSPPGSK